MNANFDEFLANPNCHEDICKVLEGVSSNYDENSEERKAIELAAYALCFIYAEDVRVRFKAFLNNINRPLSDTELAYIKSMNIDIDNFDETV